MSPRRESTTRRVNDPATSSSTSTHQRCLRHDDDFDCTHNAIPPKTKPIPIQVSKPIKSVPILPSPPIPFPEAEERGEGGKENIEKRFIPREMTLPSAHHSPNTVNRKASEFVIGTVRLSSAPNYQIRSSIPPPFSPKQIRLTVNSRTIGEKLTGFPHQQEEPDTAR